ncbi:MAG: hypothetical protein IPO16_14935 [Saprospiraceae bacterium]|nr:hypothetical protein [Saprospiraceae bacterium]
MTIEFNNFDHDAIVAGQKEWEEKHRLHNLSHGDNSESVIENPLLKSKIIEDQWNNLMT